MKTIHKYPLDSATQVIKMPDRARFRHAAEQHGQPVVWFEVDTDAPERAVRVVSVPTGGQVPDDATFLATVLLDKGSLVFHLYLEE